MKINVLLCTDRNLVDHGQEVNIALDVSPEDTISDVIEDHLKSEYGDKGYLYSSHIEIRVCK